MKKVKNKFVSLKRFVPKKLQNVYLGYTTRVILSLMGFVILFSVSLLCLSKTLTKEEGKVTRYSENGNLDYKVYLKENEFYENPYLGKNMYYIASLIKNINVDVNYKFIIEEPSDFNFEYDIVAKLSIAGDSGKNKLYEKEYTLKTKQVEAKKSSNMYMITDNVVIDYDYYNSLANKFKSTYGVDASSQLDIFVKVKKAVTNEANEINLNDTKQMTLSFPLTQKTLNITINDTGINNSQNIVSESKVSFGNVAFGIIGFIIFVGAVACLLSFLELVIKTVPKTSKYDRYIKKIIKEYDRLIVETPSEPRLEDKEIIKITRFEELLDVRDNLKRPIMHYTLIKHQKCYFYVESENRIYLLSIKAVDIEKNK